MCSMEISKRYTTAYENITNNFYQNHCGFPLAIVNHRKPLIVGIGGGLASGKTTFCESILSKLSTKRPTLLSMNLFYKDLNEDDQNSVNKNEYNFYCPQAFDFDSIYDVLFQLKNGRSANFSKYNFVTHKRDMPIRLRGGAEVVILEGLFAFCDERIRNLMDYKFFIDTDPDVCLLRYIEPPENSKDNSIAGIKETYQKYIKPAFQQFIKPSMIYADLKIEYNDEKEKVIEIIANAIKMELIKDETFAKRVKVSTILDMYNDPLSPAFNLVKEAPEIGEVQTLSAANERNKTAYYLEQLMRKLFLHIVNQICYEEVEMKLPTGEIYNGKRIKHDIHGMIVIRSQMDQALINTFRFLLKCHPVGTILINTNSPSSKPNICFHNLPKNNSKNNKIFLFDATISAGSCLKAVIHRLCEEIPGKIGGYKYLQENIIVCTLAMTKFGIKQISSTFPRITFYTPFLDSDIIQKLYNFDDEYFDIDDYNICHEE